VLRVPLYISWNGRCATISISLGRVALIYKIKPIISHHLDWVALSGLVKIAIINQEIFHSIQAI